MITIRTAQPTDKEHVLRLMDEFSTLFHASDIPSQVGSSIYDEIMRREDILIFVAEHDGQLVGLATFYILPNIRHGWHRGHIEDFFTTGSARGTGVGTQLFEGIKAYCRTHDIHVIKLDSSVELTDAHRFYEKNGGRFTEKMFRFDI